ncbi:heat-inducible transcriptional repressor HrcA [Intestinimonas massiliensis (ex Afouda et al. 2020)]|uniref:heat-inducible transcriptional repressor HrcA n=1 Tax=Intestinimonas massiliensis (ex Afouda et al. 2020) TaxID=1673721 RepID=UPI0010323F78|nr:heat-inducible transcriptional repressor HrcA [Intestinimonas massiliensis (ex Afouda et al. 2020)]
MDLTERKRRILRAIIESYIQSAEPVGSKAIAQAIGMEVSSATIRNEMADLESMGLLEKPHTSAGRIPSPKGYRFYVNELMEEHKLSLQETERMNQALRLKMQELDRVLDQAGRVVSQLTNYPAFALSSGMERVTIRRFDLLMVERNAFIIVVMTDSNIVRNRLIRLPSDLTEAQLQMLNTLLNTTFTGLTLEEITPELMRVAQHAAGDAYGLISLVVSFAIEVLESLERRTVHTSGLAHLLELPEYQSLDRAQPLLSYLSEDADPARFPVPKDDPMKILIGPENVADALKDTSVVVASYDIGEGMRGVIGVVGPTRMDYAKITARLSYLAEGLSRLFGQGELPEGKDDHK